MSNEEPEDYDESKAKKITSTDKPKKKKKKKAPKKRNKGNTTPYNQRVCKKCNQLICIHERNKRTSKLRCPVLPNIPVPLEPKKIVRQEQPPTVLQQTPTKINLTPNSMETPSPLKVQSPDAPVKKKQLKRKRVEDDKEEDQDEMRRKKRRKINDLAMKYKEIMGKMEVAAQKMMEGATEADTLFKENGEDMNYVVGDAAFNSQRIGPVMTQMRQIGGMLGNSKKSMKKHKEMCVGPCKQLVVSEKCLDASPVGLKGKLCMDCFWKFIKSSN